MKIARAIAVFFVAFLVINADGCESETASARQMREQHRVLVLGIDGMDPVVLQALIDTGKMPNFALLASTGSFASLATSMPPQSPVAWSNFISGAHPGVHQIYDFIHRDPKAVAGNGGVEPYLSTSRVEPPETPRSISVGNWSLPLTGATVQSLRQGPTFWDALVEHDVATTIYRVPANYPPPHAAGPGCFCCISGMGTPDLLGTYGEFSFYTPTAPIAGKTVPGGSFVYLNPVNDRATGVIVGPANPLAKPDANGVTPPMEIEFEIVRDHTAPAAKITIDEVVSVLNQGEWSDWIPLQFPTGAPGSAALEAAQLPARVPAMVRMFLKSVRPNLELYVSPLNIDPLDQATPISEPADFAADLAEATGRFYTTGIPEDTQALRAGALDEEQFLEQVALLYEERLEQYRHALSRFERGCLFFYFGHIDQLSHMFWRDRDADHPGRVEPEAKMYATLIDELYVEIDALLGKTLEQVGEDTTIIVCSDHGFASFRRGFNLNTWLLENGYLALKNPRRQGYGKYLSNVDWSNTRAYALGLNGLYVNQVGREHTGVVDDAERQQLLNDLANALLDVRDVDGTPVVHRVYDTTEMYAGADPLIAPDLLIGYARNYRASWATVEGGVPKELLEDNLSRWSGDHCIAAELVPGVLLTNRRLQFDDPSLSDLAPTLLGEFDIVKPNEMTGRDLFERD